MEDLHEYIITLHKLEDSDEFYHNLETLGGTITIPEREVVVHRRRPISRNTHYMLTHEEAKLINTDPRVAGVTLAALILNSITPNWTTSTEIYDKTQQNIGTHYNWGIKRCTNGVQLTSWGTDNVVAITGTSSHSLSGKNVDVIVVDGHVNPAHPTFSINANGTGSSRVNQFNWYTLNSVAASLDDDAATVLSGNYTYTPYSTGSGSDAASDNNHGCHVAGVVAGNENGWARDATIYNISPYSTNPNSLNSLIMWDYIRAFHASKPVNAATGIKNPTICNCSYGSSITFPNTSGYTSGSITYTNYRGVAQGNYSTPLTSNQLTAAGIYNTTVSNVVTATVPYFNVASEADIQQAIDDGIIIVAAAGNSSFFMDTKTGLDYNNTFAATWSGVNDSWNQHMGTAPACASTVIAVGAIGELSIEKKAVYSNTGPRVSIFAPGSNIMSSFNNTDSWGSAADQRNGSYVNGKISGTSMACPQVCGVLACALEMYPTMTQSAALKYIQHHAKLTQLTDTDGGTLDRYSLQGASNLYLYAYPERPLLNVAYPKVNFKIRPTSGYVFPRAKIRVYKT